ncbi:sodium:solute symporter family protein [Kineococcus sp. SYSU DK003]|uniref:sodium:solute symporter family protein n=1 Tax=Kineococcus sp. SYSU DK003 TaxID=3383124 RepID=UPI003D7C7F1E
MDVDLRLEAKAIDYAFVVVYFAVVLGVGFIARRTVHDSRDFFLSGRRLPAWITALAFLSANIGAVELIGMAANGAQYGMPTTHYYWIGAIPAMVFLGLVMMPFYYGSKVRSVPEFLRLRFNRATHLYQSVVFAIATALVAGINLYALALLVNVLIGWPIWLSIGVAAAVVLVYTGLGGLTAAIYNEVLQFFVVVAAMTPLTIAGLHRIGGWDGLVASTAADPALAPTALHAWGGTGVGEATNPFGNWILIVLGIGFVNSFGYWTTNFTEVQRALSAKDMSAAQRTPILAAAVKMLLPAIVIVPGMVAGQLVVGLGEPGLPYNEALPALIDEVLPNGLLGLALAGLMAAFMAGMAANVSAFNTVVTYDIVQTYVRKDRPDAYYLRVGRRVNVHGVLVGVATAFIAARFDNLQDYIQQLQSYFNAPLFTTFIIALFWKRMTPWAGLAGLLAGTAGAVGTSVVGGLGWVTFNSSQMASFVGMGVAFVAGALACVVVSLVTTPKPVEELDGLVWGRGRLPIRGAAAVPVLDGAAPEVDEPWWRRPLPLGLVVLAGCLALNLAFA